MANRIVQAIYDLKDNVTAKLRDIGDAYRKSKADSDKAAGGVERSNSRLASSFAAVAKSAKAFGAALVAAAAVVGLDKLREGIVAVLQTGEELQNLDGQFAAVFGGVEQGAQALERVKELAKDVPISLDELAEAAVELRKRGFDPLDGTLQALVDNNSALEGSQQDLLQTIDALGKANLRGEVRMRALVSLSERGIPVFDLLGKALGKTEAEVRGLAESGQLGGDAVKLLVTELGKLRTGGAQAEMREFSSQITKLRDQLRLIAGDLADGGPLELARDQLIDLNGEVARLAASPEFDALKESLRETFGAGVEAVRAFADNFDLTKQIGQITVYTNLIRDTFRLLEAADDVVEPVFDAITRAFQPFEVLTQVAGAGLGKVVDKLEEVRGKAKEVEEQFEGTITPLTLIRDEIAVATAAIEGFKKAIATTEAAKSGLSVEAAEIVKSLRDVVETEAGAREAIKGLFESIGDLPDTRLGDVALAVGEIGAEAGAAGTNVRDALGAELKKLSGEDLLRFQQAAQVAFAEFGGAAEEAAIVLESTLLTALEKLGVSGDSLGTDFTAAGEEIIATFRAVATSAVATGAQIEAGFKAALARVSTSEEAKALGAALEEAGKRGVVGLDAAERSAAALRARLREIEEAASPLADAFERLGITSQRELKNTADTAREAFDVIVSGAQRGQAATEDVRRAFVAYAKAQLDAAANSTAWERAQVESMLRVRAQALGVTDALGELGLAGERAGSQVAGGANQATDALRGTEAAAQGAAGAASDLAASGASVAVSLTNVGAQAQQAAFQIEGVSAKFNELLASQSAYSQGQSGQLFRDLQAQNEAFDETLRIAQQQNAVFDPIEQRVVDLRAQFQLLSDDRLRQLAQEQLAVEERQRAEQEALQAKIKADRESRMFRPGGNSNASSSGGTGDSSGSRAASGFGPPVTINVSTFGELTPAVRRDLARQLSRELDKELRTLGSLSR